MLSAGRSPGSRACSRGSMAPFLDPMRGPPQSLVPARRGDRRDPAGGLAGGVQAGGAEDAALRQQVGVPGGGRPAGRHAARADRPRAARHGRISADRARGDRLSSLRRDREPDQLQRAGAPVLPAARVRSWAISRSTWSTSIIATAAATRSPARSARSWTRIGKQLRRGRHGGGGASRSAGAFADRRGDLRSRLRRADAGGEAGARAIRRRPGYRRHRRHGGRQCPAIRPARAAEQGGAIRCVAEGHRRDDADGLVRGVRDADPQRRGQVRDPGPADASARAPERRSTSC